MESNKLDERSSPFGYWNFADSFFKTADVAHNKLIGAIRFSTPIYYLYAHALELSLKAFLRCKGVEVKILKEKFGHDLKKLLDEAKKKGLLTNVQLAAEQIAVIEYISSEYDDKNLEYFIQGSMSLPDLNKLHDTAEVFLKALRPICEKTIKAE